MSNQCGSLTLSPPEFLNPTTYHSKLSYPLPRDLINPINPVDPSTSRDHIKFTTIDGHLPSHDPKHSTNPDDLNPTLTDVPISIISGDALPQSGTWKRFQRSAQNLTPPQGIKLHTKRSSNFLSDPIELPCKRRLVSQKDNGNIELLAEAGQQPCQEQ